MHHLLETEASMPAQAPRRCAGRWPAVLPAAAVLAAMTQILAAGPAGAAAAGTVPRPQPGQVAGVATRGGGAVSTGIDVFYQQINHRLTVLSGSASGSFGPAADLGGALTSGPAAVIRQPPGEFIDESVFARGTDNAIWYRSFSDGLGQWLGWRSLGGRAAGAPSATCTSPTSPLLVYVRGADNALWRRPVGGSWSSLGGQLGSDPAALPAVRGLCPGREDIFALGRDLAVWERVAGGWHLIGGRSAVAPTAVQLAGGETDLFVRGTDRALWMNARAPGAATWAGWRRIGGVLTSAPVANVFPGSPQTRVVFALGGDGNLWRCRNLVGTASCDWSPVP
jgi:hypothetical protein